MRPHSPARRLTHPLVLTLALTTLASPAEAEAFVSVSAARSGSVVSVSGSASLPDGPPVQIAEDATGDVAPLTGNLAGDLTKVTLATEADGDLAVRWYVASLPSLPNGTAGVSRFRFRTGGAGYEIAAARSDVSGFDGCTSSNVPCRGGWLLRCGSANCSWSPQGAGGGATLLSRDVTVSLDSAGPYVQATVPSAALAGVLAPGATVGPYEGMPSTEASTTLGQLELSNEVDAVEMSESYTYGLVVSLAAAAPDTDPTTLDYATPATVAPNNFAFSGTLEVPQGHAVFAEACLGGPANCAHGRSDAV